VDAPPPPRRSPLLAFLRRAWPYLVGAAILIALVTRVPFAAFRASIGHGPHLALAAFDLASIVALLGTDSLAAWVGLRAVGLPRGFVDVSAVRGTNYLLTLVNYALGQGAFGYYLHRTGAPPARALGATLFLMGINLATLLVLTSAAWAVDGRALPNVGLWWILTLGCVGFALYLAVIAAAPGVLARRAWLTPLFDAGLVGHGAALLGRLPHVLGVVITQWLAMRLWGLDVPVADALTIVPALAIAAALPISPGGLGTMQAATVYFFAAHAPGATADERAAAALAFSIVHLVYSALAVVLVGLVCVPRARRSGGLPPTASDPAAPLTPG